MIKRTMMSGKSILPIYSTAASFVVLRIAMSNHGGLAVGDGKQFLASSESETLLCFILQQALAASTYKLVALMPRPDPGQCHSCD